MTTIAFIGLGNMGGPMAGNLVKAGHNVLGFDLVPAALEAARARGVVLADSAKAAVATAEVVVTMLPSGKHVIAATTGAEGLFEAAKPGTLFIDSSDRKSVV